MVKRRRTRVRRTLRRRRAGGRRRMPRMPRRSGLASKPHLYKRTMTVTDNTQTTAINLAVGAGGALSWTAAADSWNFNTGTGANLSFFSMGLKFSIGQLPDYTDFFNLYDMYKINRIKLRLTPYSTQSNLQIGGAGANQQPLGIICHSLIDLDDGAAFAAGTAGVNAMRQYVTYKTRNLLAGKPLKRYWRPRIALGVFDATAGSSAARVNSTPKWIDMVYTNVDHYGCKLQFEVFQPDTATPCFIWFKLEATYYLEMKLPR